MPQIGLDYKPVNQSLLPPLKQIRAHSESHPRTEGILTGTLVNVRDLRQNSGECQGGSREYGVVQEPLHAPFLNRLFQGDF